MNVQDLADVIRVRGHQVRVKGTEVVFRTCLYCGNQRWNLEASGDKGVYHCWAGGCSGTVAGLLADIGASVPAGLEVRVDQARPGTRAPKAVHGTVPLDTQPSALAYLAQRGVDESTAQWLGIQVQTQGDYTPRVVIPLQEFWFRYPIGYISRGYGPAGGPKYLVEAQCSDSLPGWGWTYQSDTVVLVEGVFDALAVRKAGYPVAMLLGTGRVKQAVRWASLAPPEARVLVMLDYDALNQALALANELRTVRWRVDVATVPEGMDPGALPPEQLKALVEATQ